MCTLSLRVVLHEFKAEINKRTDICLNNLVCLSGQLHALYISIWNVNMHLNLVQYHVQLDRAKYKHPSVVCYCYRFTCFLASGDYLIRLLIFSSSIWGRYILHNIQCLSVIGRIRTVFSLTEKDHHWDCIIDNKYIVEQHGKLKNLNKCF